MTIQRAVSITIVFSGLVLWGSGGGCGDSGKGGPGPDSGVVDRAYLEIVPPPGQDIGLRPGGEVLLRVRYVDEGHLPIAGGRVRFSLLGETGGATLNAPYATSGADGLVEMGLKAGFDEAVFHVAVNADGAGTIRYAVAVSNAGFGALAVGVENLGTRDASEFGQVAMYLYLDGVCGELDPLDLGSAHKERSIAALDETALFEFLPLDASYAVGGVGLDADGAPISWGCIDIVEGQLKEGLVLHARLPLRDLYASPVGHYLVETELAMSVLDSDTLSDGVDRWVDLGDCPNDPAEAVVDCVVAALENPTTPPEDLDCSVSGTSGLALEVSDRRGVVAGGCRSDEDEQQQLSVEKLLMTAMVGLPEVAQLQSLASSGVAPLEFVELHSVMELLRLEAPDTFSLTHTMYAVRFPITPVEVFVDLDQMLLPVIEVSAVPVTREAGHPATLAIGDHEMTIRMPRMLLKAFVEGYLGGQPGASVLEAFQAVLARIEPPAWYPAGDPLEACPLLDAYICHAVNHNSGCLLADCQTALAAMALQLERGLRDAESDTSDLRFGGGLGPLEDQDGDLEAESIGTLSAPGVWDVTLRFEGGQQSTSPATFVGYAPLVPIFP